MKTYTERKALELLSLPCLGYHTYSPDGNEFDCEYQAECICNFGELHGHIDPRTNHHVSRKILDKMREIYSLPFRRMKDHPLSPEQFRKYLEDLKYWKYPTPYKG